MSDPPVRLRPLEPSELGALIERIVASYGDERARAAEAPSEAGRRNARLQIASLLPLGLATPNHHLFAALEGEAIVGHLWLAMVDYDGFPSAYVYDLWLDDAARGRGLGRRVMELAEAAARRLGARDLELHVFAHNARARRLYESLDYRVTGVVMRKRLSG